MAEKPEQESFLAQLSEVEIVPVPVQSQQGDQVMSATTPAFDTKVDSVHFGESSNHLKSEHQGNACLSKQPTASHSFVTASAVVPSHSANGESSVKILDSPKTQNSTPQTVTGNVKIQLMEISVEEFKSNVEYIQQQFPKLPRRLVCDTFSKANFDSRLAIELLTKEQEKKDQSIMPTMVLTPVSKQHHQQQHHQQQKTPSTASTATGAAASSTSPVAPTPQSPRATPRHSDTAATPAAAFQQRSRRSQSSSSSPSKEDPCYRRVTSVDKEAERVLRQKLKSNVRSRVFNHGVKIAHGRETAANIVQRHHPADSPSATATASAAADQDSSMDASITKSEDASADASMPPGAAAAAAAIVEEDDEEPPGPQSALRILRDSFPMLDEVRIAESLQACDQDVDAAIRMLSGRPIIVRASPGGGGGVGADAGGSSGAKFFKSKHQVSKEQAKKDYVRAELSTGAWMERPAPRTPSSRGQTGAAASVPVGAATTTTLRVYTVQPKKRISQEYNGN